MWVSVSDNAFWNWLYSSVSSNEYSKMRKFAYALNLYYCLQYNSQTSIFRKMELFPPKYIWDQIFLDDFFWESDSDHDTNMLWELFKYLRTFHNGHSEDGKKLKIADGSLSSPDFPIIPEDIEKGFIEYLDTIPEYSGDFLYHINEQVELPFKEMFSPDTKVAHETIRQLRYELDFPEEDSILQDLTEELADYLLEFYSRPKEAIIQDIKKGMIKKQAKKDKQISYDPKKNQFLNQFVTFLSNYEKPFYIQDPFTEIRKPLNVLADIRGITFEELFNDNIDESYILEKKMRRSSYGLTINKEKYQKALDYYSKYLNYRKKLQQHPVRDDHKLISFEEQENILYIGKSAAYCRNKGHEVISVTGLLSTKHGTQARINCNYCESCKKYFISTKEYLYYQKLFGFLLGNLTFEDNSKDSESSFNKLLAPESLLYICGYNVKDNNGKGLTASERQDILGAIMNHGIMEKNRVMEYLQTFINTREYQPNMKDAVEKWKEDLDWVRNYNINKQQKFYITTIKKN